MERNMSFDGGSLDGVAVHLAWGQLEIFADDVDRIQVMAAGDDGSVNDLRIGEKEGWLVVEQPQYGLSLNITESRWLQICVRMPKEWKKTIACNTISGLLSARGLRAKSLTLETVSGDLRAPASKRTANGAQNRKRRYPRRGTDGGAPKRAQRKRRYRAGSAECGNAQV